MNKIIVVSSGKYTSFCNSMSLLQGVIGKLEISIFAPEFNELTAGIDSRALSYFRISQKPTPATFDLITSTIEDKNCLVLVYSKFLIPKSFFSCYSCINFHPSVLPSFPGLSGYKNSLAHCHLGFTAHKIDESIDEGPRIVSCQILPFPSLDRSSIDKVSYRMCSLLTAYVIRLFNRGGIEGFTYQHYSSSSIEGLEIDMR